jgi:hypothetical protein
VRDDLDFRGVVHGGSVHPGQNRNALS